MGRKRKDGRSTITVSPTTTAILHGEADLSVWSEEELLRGQRRDKNGRWSSKKPVVVPTAIHDELVRRKLSAGFALLRDNLVAACELFVEIVKDKDADPHARIKAAQTILQYVAGKPTERVLLGITNNPEPKWQKAITESLVIVGTEADIIDAKVVEEPKAEHESKPKRAEGSARKQSPVIRTNRRGASIRDRRLGRA